MSKNEDTQAGHSAIVSFLKVKFENSVLNLAKNDSSRLGNKLWWFNLFSSMTEYLLQKFPKTEPEIIPPLINGIISNFARLILLSAEIVLPHPVHDLVEFFSNEISDKDVMDVTAVIVKGTINTLKKSSSSGGCCSRPK